MKNKKHNSRIGTSLGLYTVGTLNLIHGAYHLIQTIQSTYLTASNFIENSWKHGSDNSLEKIFHNPYMGILWGAIGIGSIYMAYLDGKNHKKQDKHISNQDAYIIKIEKENSELKEKNLELENTNSDLEEKLETKI